MPTPKPKRLPMKTHDEVRCACDADALCAAGRLLLSVPELIGFLVDAARRYQRQDVEYEMTMIVRTRKP